jgi:hypothetical protein
MNGLLDSLRFTPYSVLERSGHCLGSNSAMTRKPTVIIQGDNKITGNNFVLTSLKMFAICKLNIFDVG